MKKRHGWLRESASSFWTIFTMRGYLIVQGSMVIIAEKVARIKS